MKKIGSEVIKELIDKSRLSPRLRSHFNIHEDLNEEIQRLLICLQPGTFVRPHYHPELDKKEMIILIQGKCACVNFDENGIITESFILSHEECNTVCEFPPLKYHSLICLEPDTVVIEVKKGPYTPLDTKCFAQWAPEESSAEKEEYLTQLIKDL